MVMVASIEEWEMENKIIEKDERESKNKKKYIYIYIYSNKTEKNTTFEIECITKWMLKYNFWITKIKFF